MRKKGQMSLIINLAVGIAILAIVLTVTFIVLAQGQSQVATATGVSCNSTSGTVECNGTRALSAAVDDIPPYIGLVVITVVGVALIGLISLLKNRG